MPTLFESYPSLSTMTPDELNALSSKMKTKHIKAGEHWVTEGKICTLIGHLESGILRTYFINKTGEKITLFFFTPGSPVTEFESFINKTPSKFYIECIKDATIHTLTYEDRAFLMHTIPNYELVVIKTTDIFLTQISNRMVNMTLLSAEERYIRLLETEPTIFDYLTLSSIAEYINIKPQSLSRIRKKLKTGI